MNDNLVHAMLNVYEDIITHIELTISDYDCGGEYDEKEAAFIILKKIKKDASVLQKKYFG